MKPSFDHTVSILVKAYLNDTLVHGNCYACAVGNIVASSIGTEVIKGSFNRCRWANGLPYPADNGIGQPGWGKVFATSTDPFTYKKKQEIELEAMEIDTVKFQIDSTGYKWYELARMERAFEGVDKRRKNKMFNGLMAVIDVLADIHNIDLTQKETAKALFVK